MAVCIVMSGPAGVGKSTAAEKIKSAQPNFYIVSSDAIREEIYGSAEIQDNPQKIFGIFYNRANRYLRRGYNVILDATNLTPKSRKRALALAKKHNARTIGINVVVDVDTALEQNARRDRHVPESVIRNMYDKYVPCSTNEGFDSVMDWRE